MNPAPPSPFGDGYVGPLGAWAGDGAVPQHELDAATLGTLPGPSVLSMVLEGEREAWKRERTNEEGRKEGSEERLPVTALAYLPTRIDISQAVREAHEAQVERMNRSRPPAEVEAEFTWRPDIKAFEVVLADRNLAAAIAALGPGVRGTVRF